MTTKIATIGDRGQVIIPEDIRQRIGIGPADQVEILVTVDDTIELRPVRHDLESIIGTIPIRANETGDFRNAIESSMEEAAKDRVRRMHQE
jgi:AbrB family looped-hinge helix DNA binding protein